MVVYAVAIGMHGKFAQGVINWNRFLFRCSSTAQVLVEGVRLSL